MAGSSESLTIVLVIISLAHSLKRKVIAEGVDDAAQMDLLRQYGCDEAQGYLIVTPCPPGNLKPGTYGGVPLKNLTNLMGYNGNN
jgi:EAL domain-containing protein (putative c-di-GMP-specific phosphodiesterase class I)